MKIIALFSFLIYAFLSWSAFADEQDSKNTKYSSMHEKCLAMGERHGLSGGRLAAWMDRCMTMSKLPKDDVDSKEMSMGGMDGMPKQKTKNGKKGD